MPDRARALIVDDEELIRVTLETVLLEEDFDVRVARNGAEALALLHTWRADVIVLDLMMPRMNGWTFRARLREQPELADIPVVVLSGAHEARARAQELGVAAAVSKPFSLDDVVATVRRVLDRSAAPDRLRRSEP